MRRSARATRAPTRLELDVSDTALQQALRKSLLETTRVTLAVPEAPVFRPTVEEFDDPLAYISSIQGSAAAAGIAKIVPPPGWRRPKLDLNVQQLFTTKRQQVHALQEGLPFAEGQRYNQQTYRTYAEAFTIAWQQLHPELAAAAAEAGPAAATKLLEDQYWRIVERVGSEEVVVDYANDIDTQKYGSGFGPWAGKWDLSKLVSAPQSSLQQLGFSVEGLTHPWLYFGALFATFCWHTEDHFLYSLNYLHEGAAKTWYGVPGSAARRFEDVMRTSAPERFSEERDLLHQLITLLPPSLLAAQGVRVVHTVQEPGEFVVTFPKAYHCGFSHGWNASEAVNFATLDWLPFGLEAARRYAKGPGKRPAVFSHDKLLWELCEDALEAARQSNGALLRAAPPAAAKQHSQQPAQPQIGKDGKPIDPVAIANYGISLAPAAREASPAALPPPPKPRPLPPPQGRRVAHFTPAQVKQLAEALQIVTTTELKARGDLRTEGCRDATWFGGGGVATEVASCHICGAQPYLSAVTCSCNPAELRCLAHSHIGCTCGWQHKSLLQRLPDPALSHARREMKDLALQGRHVHAVLTKREGVKSAASLQAGEVPRARPSVKQPAELAPPAAAAAAQPAAAGAAAGAAKKAASASAAGAAAAAQQRGKRRTPPPGQQGKPSAKRGKASAPVKVEAQPASGSGATKASIAAAGAMRQAAGQAAANTAGLAAGPQRLSGVQKRARMRMEAKLKAASIAAAAAAQPLAGTAAPAQSGWAAAAAASVRIIVSSSAAAAVASGGTTCSRDSSPAIGGGATGGGGSGTATDGSGFTPGSSLTPISSGPDSNAGPAAIRGSTPAGSSSAPLSSGPAASGSRSTSPSSGPVASGSSPAADSGSPAAEVPTGPAKVAAATGAEPAQHGGPAPAAMPAQQSRDTQPKGGSGAKARASASPDTGAERALQSPGASTPRRKRPRKLQLTDRDDPALHRAPDGRALSELSLAEAAALLAQQPRAIGQPSLWTRALRLAAGQPRFIKTSPKQPRQPRSPSPVDIGNGAAGPGTPVAAEAPDRLQAAKQLKTGAGAGAANFVISRSGPGVKASG